jgi:hypothetical protein
MMKGNINGRWKPVNVWRVICQSCEQSRAAHTSCHCQNLLHRRAHREDIVRPRVLDRLGAGATWVQKAKTPMSLWVASKEDVEVLEIPVATFVASSADSEQNN